MSEWVKCTDRLPEVGENVIIFDGEEVVTATLSGLGVKFDGSAVFWGFEEGYAGKVRFYSKFWMPKPAPPVSCMKCKGAGQVDSGGTQPWGDTILVTCECQFPDKSPMDNLQSQSLSEAAPELFSLLKTITDNCYGMRSGFEFKWDHDTSLDGLELLNKAKELVRRIQDDSDGWIVWLGGDSAPVNGMVEVRLRTYITAIRAQPADDWFWGHRDAGDDIIAYRVIENDGREG